MRIHTEVQYSLAASTLFEIRVFQGGFANTYYKGFPQSVKNPFKIFWKIKQGFWWETLPKGFPETLRFYTVVKTFQGFLAKH
jgi:hypothetical protein